MASFKNGTISVPEDVPDGAIFEEDGKKYMWARNTAGGRYRKQMGGLVHNPHARPLPQGMEMTALTSTQAAQTVSASLKAMDREMNQPKTDEETDRMIR